MLLAVVATVIVEGSGWNRRTCPLLVRLPSENWLVPTIHSYVSLLRDSTFFVHIRERDFTAEGVSGGVRSFSFTPSHPFSVKLCFSAISNGLF